jgi:hypothetical protein
MSYWIIAIIVAASIYSILAALEGIMSYWKIAVIVVAFIYSTMAVLALIANMGGPETPALALVRAILWPLWMMGFIQGEHARMD